LTLDNIIAVFAKNEQPDRSGVKDRDGGHFGRLRTIVVLSSSKSHRAIVFR
jgi:hypothetical protein